MVKKIIIAILLGLLAATPAGAVEKVTFKVKMQGDKELTLAGELTKPKGEGPFPAVVLLHGGSGIEAFRKEYEEWMEWVTSWGYVALLVDSFNFRQGRYRDPYRQPVHRAQDAHAAKSYLAKLPFVDGNRITMVGWSMGGSTILHALDMPNPIEGDPFRAAVAFYPYCRKTMTSLDAPLLILHGELDTLHPAINCRNAMPVGKTAHEVILKVYPGANHHFRITPAVHADSIVRTKEFLAKHMQ